MAVKGTVKSAGYKTGGQVPYRGMKNKRKAKKRKAKMLEIAERRRLQMEEAMKDGTYEDTYGWY
jgi:hypothetical protein